MAYEARGRRKYYYRSRYVDGRVVKEYLGTGPAAQRAAAEVAQRRRDREERRCRDAKFELELTSLRQTMDDYFHAAERAWRLACYALGYHCHRGEWRRRRD